MIKGISITIIIDEIKNVEDIDLIKDSLLNVFPKETNHQSTEAYTKFPDAYKLEFSVSSSETAEKEKIIYHLLLLADGIARPWLVFFDKEGDSTELIFNRDGNTHVTQPAFYAIRWAHIQLNY